VPLGPHHRAWEGDDVDPSARIPANEVAVCAQARPAVTPNALAGNLVRACFVFVIP